MVVVGVVQPLLILLMKDEAATCGGGPSSVWMLEDVVGGVGGTLLPFKSDLSCLTHVFKSSDGDGGRGRCFNASACGPVNIS